MESIEERLIESLQYMQALLNEVTGTPSHNTNGNSEGQTNPEVEHPSPAPLEPTYPHAPEESEQRELNEPIPENSRTFLIREETSRFSGAVWFDKVQDQIVTLAGLGGIGRFGNLNYFSYLCTY